MKENHIIVPVTLSDPNLKS